MPIETDTITPKEAGFLTVSICTYNRAEPLQRAIANVLEQLDERSELLVVDNNSTDETPSVLAALAARCPAVRVVREPRAGLPFARNTAVRHARGEHILFFDDDQTAEPGWLAEYRKFLTKPPTNRLGCVGGPYLAHHEAPVPDWLEPAYGEFRIASETRRIDGPTVPAGGNCAYPTRLVLEMGGFLTELPRKHDSELNLRLRDAGHEVWWLETAPIRHWIPARRMKVKVQINLWYVDGWETAICRMRSAKSPGQKFCFWISRAVTTPILISIQLAGAGLSGLLGRRRQGCRLLFRACRSWGLWRQLFGLGKI